MENPPPEEETSQSDGAPEDKGFGRFRISWFQGFWMLLVAGFIDIIGFVLDFVGAATAVVLIGFVLLAVNRALSAITYFCFWFWFTLSGVSFNNWIKVGASLFFGIAELTLTAGPWITLNVALTIGISAAEDISHVKISKAAYLKGNIAKRKVALKQQETEAVKRGLIDDTLRVGENRRIIRGPRAGKGSEFIRGAKLGHTAEGGIDLYREKIDVGKTLKNVSKSYAKGAPRRRVARRIRELNEDEEENKNQVPDTILGPGIPGGKVGNEVSKSSGSSNIIPGNFGGGGSSSSGDSTQSAA